MEHFQRGRPLVASEGEQSIPRLRIAPRRATHMHSPPRSPKKVLARESSRGDGHCGQARGLKSRNAGVRSLTLDQQPLQALLGSPSAPTPRAPTAWTPQPSSCLSFHGVLGESVPKPCVCRDTAVWGQAPSPQPQSTPLSGPSAGPPGCSHWLCSTWRWVRSLANAIVGLSTVRHAGGCEGPSCLVSVCIS